MARPQAVDTPKRVEQYYGKIAILQTWEKLPLERQLKDKPYLDKLRKTIRYLRVNIMNRADPEADIT